MLKKDFIKLFENIDDETNIVIPSTTQFEGYNIISEDIELIEDYDEDNKKIVVLQEKNRFEDIVQ